MAERDFKGVWIPKEVWLDERLNALEKVILAEIDSLDMGDDGCWASNEYLAKFCQCSGWKVSTSVSKLTDLGYITSVSFDGRTRKLKSCLAFSQRLPCEKPKADLGKSQAINTKNNIENNKSLSRKSAESESPLFTAFWEVYPKRVSKQTAWKAWQKLGKVPDKLFDTIIADVKRRVDGEWKGKDIQYIPYPSTYLNQRRWEDEQPSANATDQSQQPTAKQWEQMSREEQAEAMKSGPYGRFY